MAASHRRKIGGVGVNGWRRYGIPLSLAVLGGAMVWYGIGRGEMDVVFIKAVNLCMECIGLG